MYYIEISFRKDLSYLRAVGGTTINVGNYNLQFSVEKAVHITLTIVYCILEGDYSGERGGGEECSFKNFISSHVGFSKTQC